MISIQTTTGWCIEQTPQQPSQTTITHEHIPHHTNTHRAHTPHFFSGCVLPARPSFKAEGGCCDVIVGAWACQSVCLFSLSIYLSVCLSMCFSLLFVCRLYISLCQCYCLFVVWPCLCLRLICFCSWDCVCVCVCVCINRNTSTSMYIKIWMSLRKHVRGYMCKSTCICMKTYTCQWECHRICQSACTFRFRCIYVDAEKCVNVCASV